MLISIYLHTCLLNFTIRSLLVFAQRQCNQKLAIFMTILYYFQAILGTTLFHAILPVFDFVGAYWFSIAHPLSRIPVFFMGVCAGVICVRIQEQDFDAMNCKYFVIFQSMFNYSTSHLIVTCELIYV